MSKGFKYGNVTSVTNLANYLEDLIEEDLINTKGYSNIKHKEIYAKVDRTISEELNCTLTFEVGAVSPDGRYDSIKYVLVLFLIDNVPVRVERSACRCIVNGNRNLDSDMLQNIALRNRLLGSLLYEAYNIVTLYNGIKTSVSFGRRHDG